MPATQSLMRSLVLRWLMRPSCDNINRVRRGLRTGSLVTQMLLAMSTAVWSCSDADPAARKQKGAADPSAAQYWMTSDAGVATIQSIFKDKCSGCHPALGKKRDYASYEVTKTNITNVMERINDGSMPPGGLDADLKATIQRWVDAGLPETP